VEKPTRRGRRGRATRPASQSLPRGQELVNTRGPTVWACRAILVNVGGGMSFCAGTGACQHPMPDSLQSSSFRGGLSRAASQAEDVGQGDGTAGAECRHVQDRLDGPASQTCKQGLVSGHVLPTLQSLLEVTCSPGPHCRARDGERIRVECACARSLYRGQSQTWRCGTKTAIVRVDSVRR
jgi:hypothetical protein